MKNFFLLAFLVAMIALVAVEVESASTGNADFDMFSILYQKIVDIVSPSQNDVAANDGRASPKAVLLTENPGRAINRDDYDANTWARNNFRDRQPSAVAAALVNRAPRYWDTTFVDSGSTISGIWNHFMHQYAVPSFVDETQQQRLEEAREKLWGENSTLEEDFFDALDTYEADFRASLASRETCLAAQGGEICSQLLVIDELRLSVSWFNMEVRRRDLHGAQSLILALQVQDLTTIFADGLRKFERQKRVDVGAVGFGTEFYQTFFEPSDWWQWWSPSYQSGGAIVPNDVESVTYGWDDLVDQRGRDIDVLITNDGGVLDDTDLVNVPDGAVLSAFTATGFTITPNDGYSGPDSFSFALRVSGEIITVEVIIGGRTPGSAGAAFSKVTFSTTESSSATETATSSFNSESSFRVSSSFFWRRWYGGAGGTASFSTSQTSEWGSDESTTIAFEIAKVSIQRPWLDMSLVSFKPVAIRGLTAYQWSTGTGLPDSTVAARFPLLPTDMIISRNIVISTSLESFENTETAIESAVSYRSNGGFNMGFWGFGYQTQTSSKNSYQKASYTTTATTSTLVIDGPQIMGWVCTPVPKFPTASSDFVETLMYGKVITPYSLVETDQVS